MLLKGVSHFAGVDSSQHLLLLSFKGQGKTEKLDWALVYTDKLGGKMI